MFNLLSRRHKNLPIRRDEEHHISHLQREMNKLFEDFFPASTWETFGSFPSFESEQFFGDVAPRLDMSETDKELLVKVELPGMTEKDVDISINRDTLTISGEKKKEKEHTEKGWYKMERQYGSFSRSIPLPYDIETDKAEATFKNGLLSITMPKSAVQQKAAKSITVKSA